MIPTIIYKRIEVWNDTQNKNNTLYKSVKPSIKYNRLGIIDNNVKDSNNITNIIVLNMDTIDCAYNCKNDNPLLLNMGDDCIPGGFVSQGSGAQEENIYRRSNLDLTLIYELYYPLRDCELVYSPDITIHKSNELDNYQDIEPWNLSIITSPGLRHPQLTEDNKLNNKDRELMINKIKLILSVAKMHNHKTLVLSAHGCGAWKSPPEEIAQLYKDTINEYSSYFNTIYFAILGENYEIFKNILTQ